MVERGELVKARESRNLQGLYFAIRSLKTVLKYNAPAPRVQGNDRSREIQVRAERIRSFQMRQNRCWRRGGRKLNMFWRNLPPEKRLKEILVDNCVFVHDALNRHRCPWEHMIFPEKAIHFIIQFFHLYCETHIAKCDARTDSQKCRIK